MNLEATIEAMVKECEGPGADAAKATLEMLKEHAKCPAAWFAMAKALSALEEESKYGEEGIGGRSDSQESIEVQIEFHRAALEIMEDVEIWAMKSKEKLHFDLVMNAKTAHREAIETLEG